MPRGLRRFQESGQSHFLTFSCYRRQARFCSPEVYDLFSLCLEQMRRRFAMCIYGYVVMPEHVHLLVSEPGRAAVPQVRVRCLDAKLATLAHAMHYLKLSFAKQFRSRTGAVDSGSFWQKRYYDRNVRDEREFMEKLRYLHRNPVKRGLVKQPAEWKWSSFRHYALREIGVVEIESQWTARDRETKALGGSERVFLIAEPALSEAEGLVPKRTGATWGTRHQGHCVWVRHSASASSLIESLVPREVLPWRASQLGVFSRVKR
jgi:putative transposase